jgi:hypothetical protein
MNSIDRTKQLGIILDNWGTSQLAYYSITKSNQILAARSDVDICGFNMNVARPCVGNNFAIFPLVEITGFQGTIIATCPNGVIASIKAPSPRRKIFYVWDLYWLRQNPRLPYEYWAQIFRRNDFELAARSESHRSIIENNFNVEVPHLIEDCDFSCFLES